MGFRRKRVARPGSRELYDRMQKAATLLKKAERLAPWYYVGCADDGPEIGALLSEAIIELWHAREVLINDLGRPPQKGEQTELDLTSSLPISAVCARCGHRSVDHTEGLRCPACGCVEFTEFDIESGLCAHPHEGPCPTSEDGDSEEGEGR